MSIKFISGNQHKYEELSSIIPNLELYPIDLPELQEIDPHEIIKAKLLEARKHLQEPMIVEDTSLYLEALGGKLPGPLIKWFVQGIGTDGVVELALKMGNPRAVAKTIIGYTEDGEHLHFFEGAVAGEVVPARVGSAFGRDPIFQPDGYDQTFSEMSTALKNQISMRRKAAQAFQDFLTA